MNRAFISPKGTISLKGAIIGALIAQIEARQATPKRITGTTDLELEHEGKRYSGSATASAMGDVQWDIASVSDVPVAKAEPKKAATKAAAKKAAPKKTAKGRK